MARIIIKGGVWKNTEDEVLKAAIAKYGKNQWARISSLLVRKTPKQCKARWYEWLDPSIKKTEWSKTEDEKLLHLAKLMPTQWRTIAPIVGRTATQCLERYQRLLDEAEQKENEELGLAGPGGPESAPTADDVRRLRPGEIDPDPETKPARPDPIDMDEDEKEMLSEARARLANTQGKKAKRKARERQLEEARRLAVLQKKRELKAAGIVMRHKQKGKGMDYNADIPFEKKPAPGFYDTSEEQARITAAPVGRTLRRLENKRKPDDDEAERKKRQRKDQNKPEHQTKFIAARDAQIQKLKEAESIGRRRKLVLPGAQVGEAELEDIVKIGRGNENARELAGDGGESTSHLVGEYDTFEAAKMARTPRTAQQPDNVMSEARNLRNMTIAQTPLLGEENTPMHIDATGGTGFEGATPRHQVAVTPNPLATPVRSDVGPTPSNLTTPLRTPRDGLSINSFDGFSSVGDTPRERRGQVSAAKAALKQGFLNLPKPENNFELLAPEDEDEPAVNGKIETEEDAAERDARARRLREKAEAEELARRSNVVKLGLPRPANVDVDKLFEGLSISEDLSEGQQLIDKELVALMRHDAVAHPIPGTTLPGGTLSSYIPPSDADMDVAKAMVQLELSELLGFPDADESQLRAGLKLLYKPEEQVNSPPSWAETRQTLAFDSANGIWTDADSLSNEDHIAGLTAQLNSCRETMAKDASKAAKVEKKLGVTMGGYIARARAISKRITDAFVELESANVEHLSFSRLQANETATGPRRVAALREEVETLDKRERLLQIRYAELDTERREAEARVSALEEKIMMDAEEINELALAEAEAAAAES